MTARARRTTGLALLAAAALLAALGGCRSTRPFTDASGRVLPRSVARIESWEVGGVRQEVWLRGRDAAAPALVLLHGGPGASESALFRHYVPELERHFLVVYWDQRGAGRSYHRGMDRDSMTLDRMERDLDVVVDSVRRRFGKARVALLGHSWGTVLGTRYAHRHPDKVSVYAGVAQVTDFARGERLSLAWAVEQAALRGERRALAELRAISPAPRSVDEELRLGRWVERFGGSLRGGLSTGSLILAALGTDEATLGDLWRFGAGNRFSLEALRPEYARVDLTRIREMRVPVVLLLGRHDWHVPSVLAARWLGGLRAPCRRLVWFEESAHNPPFEQPDAFVRAMVREVLPLAAAPASPAGDAGAAHPPARGRCP